MKGFQIVLIAALCGFWSVCTVAQSIVYRSVACSNPVNADDPTPTNTPLESRFDVIDSLGDGIYRLNLTGGLPRFVDDDNRVCIDSDTALGFIGTPAEVINGGLPLIQDSVDATAYFNGLELVIVVSSIYTDLSQARGTFSTFTTSRVRPVTNTLIFDYDGQAELFRLRTVFHNKGFTQTSGSTGALTPFIEIVVPSQDETGLIASPTILTPAVPIVYRLQ